MVLMISTEYSLDWSDAVYLITQFAIQGESIFPKMYTVFLWSSISSSFVFFHTNLKASWSLSFTFIWWYICSICDMTASLSLRNLSKIANKLFRWSRPLNRLFLKRSILGLAAASNTNNYYFPWFDNVYESMVWYLVGDRCYILWFFLC